MGLIRSDSIVQLHLVFYYNHSSKLQNFMLPTSDYISSETGRKRAHNNENFDTSQSLVNATQSCLEQFSATRQLFLPHGKHS